MGQAGSWVRSTRRVRKRRHLNKNVECTVAEPASLRENACHGDGGHSHSFFCAYSLAEQKRSASANAGSAQRTTQSLGLLRVGPSRSLPFPHPGNEAQLRLHASICPLVSLRLNSPVSQINPKMECRNGCAPSCSTALFAALDPLAYRRRTGAARKPTAGFANCGFFDGATFSTGGSRSQEGAR
jgi:hypothetical protein